VATVESVAADFLSFLTTHKRGSETIVVKNEDAPEWVEDIVYEIHGNLLPDDWTYATIKECAEYLEENGNDGGSPEADIYNSDLLAWLKNYPDATDAVDRTKEDYGNGQNLGIMEMIQQGQAMAKSEICSQLAYQFEQRAEALNEGADEDEDEETED
jgi:hypothetical protein